MAVNSPQPTLYCVITVCACLFRLYDQDFPFLDFVVLSIIAVMPTWSFLGREVGRIWRLATEPKRGQRRQRSSQRRRRDGEPPPPRLRPIGGNPWQKFDHTIPQPISETKGGGEPWRKVLPTPET